MYVRKRMAKGHEYYQVVEGYRDRATGKVRQSVLVSLGKESDPKKSLSWKRSCLSQFRETAASYRRLMERQGEHGIGLNKSQQELLRHCEAMSAKLESETKTLDWIIRKGLLGSKAKTTR